MLFRSLRGFRRADVVSEFWQQLFLNFGKRTLSGHIMPHLQKILVIKKAEPPLWPKATRLSFKDPWFSAPVSQQVWLYLVSRIVLFLIFYYMVYQETVKASATFFLPGRATLRVCRPAGEQGHGLPTPHKPKKHLALSS